MKRKLDTHIFRMLHMTKTAANHGHENHNVTTMPVNHRHQKNHVMRTPANHRHQKFPLIPAAAQLGLNKRRRPWLGRVIGTVNIDPVTWCRPCAKPARESVECLKIRGNAQFQARLGWFILFYTFNDICSHVNLEWISNVLMKTAPKQNSHYKALVLSD